ncbi:MAG: hypothetical protein EVA26_02990 [Burkholderiaceae bacterium]|nr:MAG: hypothetical protein EVA26_02990 [Burkholderiaceae bacterium]
MPPPKSTDSEPPQPFLNALAGSGGLIFGISPINPLLHVNGIHIGFTSESFLQIISTFLLIHLHTHLALSGEMLDK